jgi:[ribosomal protein S18]-alanine N-acetyltransferase
VHRHSGWLPTYYWLGKPSALTLLSAGGEISACLLACPDALGTTWIHVFAADTPPGAIAAWEQLWPATRRELRQIGVTHVWAMSTQTWFTDMLEGSGFRSTGQVVALSLHPNRILVEPQNLPLVRPMRESELDSMLALDHEAFHIPWQMDSDAFRETFRRSVLATVMDTPGGDPIGYQLSIPTTQGVHLARLAVHPKYQGHGYGRSLMIHLINYFHRRRAPVITLNTQSDNARSFRLYHELGFQEAGEIYPFFQSALSTQ